ncbi:MAG: hypothetical protein LBL90_00700 [Prevotellaceae bacterium]|jgi:hypothetical protein|nr:hypothetical protein [Prevotellaceae bacterium]
MDFDISYTDKEIRPCGGMVLMRRMLGKICFKKVVEANRDLPVPGSNRGYKAITAIESFLVSIWCGANRFPHTEVTRHDPSLGGISGWERIPGHDAFKRFFSKFSQALNLREGDYFYGRVFSQLQFDNFVLDCDSSVMTR